MPTFKLTKNISDIVEPELIPEDWYTMKITKEPKFQDNKKKKDGGPDAEGAAVNLVLVLRVQHEDPMIHGRGFTKYLRWPEAKDANEILGSGQTMEDFLTESIGQVASAFFGMEVEADEVEFEVGQEASFYVISEIDNRDGVTLRNALDINQAPKPV